MTQATHTPGPWMVNKSDIGLIGISRPLPDWPTGFHDKIADCLLTDRPSENASNAHLIAAAPDMLAALADAQILLTDLRAHELDDAESVATMAAIEAAIVKARGEG